MSQGQSYQYNRDDVRRYLEGRMTAAEMHAMEKAALEDPFLADAMEGLEAAPVVAIQSDLQMLSKKLEQRVTPAKVVPMRPERPWMAIAAAAVILVGLAMTILYTNPVPQPPVIAKVETPTSEESSPIVQTDTAATTAPSASAPAPKETQASKINQLQESKSIVVQPLTDDSAKPDSNTRMIASATENKENKPSPLGETADKSTIDKEATQRMRSVAPAAAPMAEKSKKNSYINRVYTEPADGWSAWEVYVLNNLRKPKDPSLHGNVVVSFNVNPENGKPFDIKVDKGLHPQYDKEAIRLIREGPVWAVYNTEGAVKTTVTVVF